MGKRTGVCGYDLTPLDNGAGNLFLFFTFPYLILVPSLSWQLIVFNLKPREPTTTWRARYQAGSSTLR